MDNRTVEQRSKNMSNIHSSNTKPEETVKKFLFNLGFRYRKNVAKLPGKPDIVLPKYKTVIFINGCYWHGHENCKYFVLPKSNVEFWQTKIDYNKSRDAINIEKLTSMGWKVITVWECEIRHGDKIARLNKLIEEILN